MCAPQGCLRLFARGNRGARRLNGRRRESGPQPGPIEIGVVERTIRSRAGRHPRIKRSFACTSNGSIARTGMDSAN